MKRSTKPTHDQLARVDAMLADRSGRPRYPTPSTLRARTMDRLRAEASRPVPTDEARDLTHFIWRLCVGAAGVGVVAAAWLFALQAFSLRTPPTPAENPDGGAQVRQASLVALTTLDDRLFDESRAVAAKLAGAVNASYTREVDAMRIDARRAAEAASSYKRWMIPTRSPTEAPELQ